MAGRPRGTFGDLERNALAGPGFWNVDASLFKRFRIGGAEHLEFRIEADNVFNHVNLGNPDGEIGARETQRNAGHHHQHAAELAERNLQFALRFQF